MSWQELAVEVWGLSDEERARLADAPFTTSSAEHWRWFASAAHMQALRGYAAGEMNERRLLAVVRACSLGCTVTDRIRLMAMTAERALKIRPKALNRRRPPYAAWVKKLACDGLRLFEQQGLVVSPSADSGTSPALNETLAWLKALDLCDVSPKQLYTWHLKAKHAAGEPTPRGRRPKRKNT
jgi:hypothetical protein